MKNLKFKGTLSQFKFFLHHLIIIYTGDIKIKELDKDIVNEVFKLSTE